MYYIEKLYLENIKKDEIRIIFELGSGDLLNTLKLIAYYDKSIIYSFECNPECIEECEETLSLINDYIKNRIVFIKNAICETNGITTFYPFDTTKYNNKGASSMLKIDFSMRNQYDPDYNKPNPQKEIFVPCIRLDTFMTTNNIFNIDLLCVDLQGYELGALKSLGIYLNNVKYIITQTSIQSTYTNGATFKELELVLKSFGFIYKCSKIFGYDYPNLNLTGYSEFDALFINKNLIQI